MKRTPVQSSNVRSIGYDEASQTLEVEFLNGGIYHYAGVKPGYYMELRQSSSVGRYLSINIKPFHKATKVTETNVSNPVLRAKLLVTSVMRSEDANGTIVQEQIQMQAVMGAAGTENAKWAKVTPAASFSMTITNPGAFGKLSQSGEYFVDFIPAQG